MIQIRYMEAIVPNPKAKEPGELPYMTETPVLQYRSQTADGTWSVWDDVPTITIPAEGDEE